MTDPQLAATLAALGHVLRLNLWRLLVPYGSQGLAAGEIAARMSVLPSSLSFHLRQMTHAGVLVQRRASRQVIYAVNLDNVGHIARLLALSLMQRADVLMQDSPFVGELQGADRRLVAETVIHAQALRH